MLRQFQKITLSAMLIWTLSSKELLALELEPEPQGTFACLSRDQKEKIVDCFSRVQICEAAVVTPMVPDESRIWTAVALSLAGGIVAGMILNAEIHK